MILPITVGLVSGVAIILAMKTAGMLSERSGLAVLVGAIALFYPVFAVAGGAPISSILLHGAIFLGFAILALIGFRTGVGLLSALLIAHGIFDIVAHVVGHPAPEWWPAFCAALDISAGGLLLYLSKPEGAAK
ncbi:MAG: hypothetical protein ACRBBS_02740 [Thalassovita sp.]